MNLNWSALTKQQQKIVIIITVLAVLQVVALGYFMLKNPGKSAGEARKELHELQGQLSAAKDIISRKALVEQELQKSVEDLEAMVPYAPAVFDSYAWAYEYISRRSALAGVMIDGLQEEISARSSTGNGKEAVPYEVSVVTRCGYNELIRFLWYLETGNPLIVVKELTIDESSDNPEQHSVRIVVQWPPSFKIENVDE